MIGIARACAIGLIWACASGMAGSVHAEIIHCPAIAGADGDELAQADARARLDWLDAHLMRERRRALIWSWGWGGGFAASGVGSLVAVPLDSREHRIDWYTSAVSSAIGVLPFLVAPLDVIADAKELHVRLGSAPSSHSDLCALLADAEARLARDAQNEATERAWWMHAGNLAFNAGVLLFLGLGYHHWGSGVIDGVGGAVVGEVMIFTQPTGSIEDLESYRAGRLSNGTRSAAVRPYGGWLFTRRF